MEPLSKFEKMALIGVIFLAGIISVSLIGQHRFHGDEALYAYWEISMAKSTSIYVGTPYMLYKPPFLFLVSALIFSIIPVKETFAIMPNIIAFVLSIYVFYILLLSYYKNKYVALIGAVIFALSPINLLFSATAFTDSLLVLFLLLSMYYLIEKKFFLFGLFVGFAFGTKPFAIFFIPVYLLILLLDIQNKNIKIKKDILKVVGGFFSSYSIAIIWGILNSIKYGKPALFALMSWFGITDRPESFIFNFSNLISRMKEWVYYYKIIYFSRIIYLPILILVLINLIFNKKVKDFIIAFCIVILFLITSTSQMPIYDRYILTFTPLVIMISASSLCNILKINNNTRFYIFYIIIMILFLTFPVRKGIFKYTMRNYYGETFGAMYSRNDGIDLVANYLLGKYETPVSLCMHRDFSWVMDYYMYRAPAGYCWFHYQPEEKDIEDKVKSFEYDLKNTKRKIFLLFYADNDEIERFAFFFKKYRLFYNLEYETYDRFKKRNIILYRILLK